MPIPSHLIPPELLPGADEFRVAFWELSSDRQIGLAIGPIPFSSIDAYARRSGIDDLDDFDVLLKMVRACDRAFLKHQAEQSEKNSK